MPPKRPGKDRAWKNRHGRCAGKAGTGGAKRPGGAAAKTGAPGGGQPGLIKIIKSRRKAKHKGKSTIGGEPWRLMKTAAEPAFVKLCATPGLKPARGLESEGAPGRAAPMRAPARRKSNGLWLYASGLASRAR